MSESGSSFQTGGAGKALVTYPPGFRPRRGINWGYLGLLYTSFYMCRYNFSIANKSIADEFHFSYSQMSSILIAWTWVYAFGQIINGLITDRIGGKAAMLIGAAGTIIMNVLFGAASAWGILGLFIAIRGIDGYLQSFGAPGMTKIKTAWFVKTERGGFAGIFGFMINLGRLGIFNFGPALLAGFSFFGLVHVAPLHWKWLFWGPSIVCGIVAIAMAFGVKETPEEHGYLPVDDYAGAKTNEQWTIQGALIGAILLVIAFALGWMYDRGFIGPIELGALVILAIVGLFIVLHIMAAANPPPPVHAYAAPDALASPEPPPVAVIREGAAPPIGYASAMTNPEEYDQRTTRADILVALRTIAANPAVWIVALAYACTGAVRQPVDQWFPRYMQEVYNTDMKSAQFQFLAFLIPFVASAGSLLSGYISDKLFAGARAPVAAVLYILETAIVFGATLSHSASAAVVFFVLISFTANSTHSILGTAAAMDIGGRKMTGFASGLIDSFQYFGSSIGLYILGHLLDYKPWGWKSYFPYMIPFGLLGFCLMVFGRGIIARGSHR
jgi:sugar phosphate permease